MGKIQDDLNASISISTSLTSQRPWFRKYFPVFMKYITGGYVGEEEAGQRLFQVITDPRCSKSGVYWSWNGGPRQGTMLLYYSPLS